MKTILIEYPKCSTCQKAKRWLMDQGIAFEDRNIVEQNPTAEELSEWIRQSGLPVKRFFNTSGMRYREMNLKEKLPALSEEEQIALLATDGMLVKRPLAIQGNTILPGFQPEKWEQLKISGEKEAE